MSSIHHPGPVEPVLPLSDIQGIVIPGFFKPSQTLIYVHHGHDADTVDKVKAFLREVAGEITDGTVALKDRRAHRMVCALGETSAAPCVPMTAIAFTYQGLRALTPQADDIPSPAFRSGLAARSALLGDPRDEEQEGHPRQWVIGAPGNEPDFMIVVAGDERTSVGNRVAALISRLSPFSHGVVTQDGERLRAPASPRGTQALRVDGHEHFGFADGISQPGIRGRASDAAGDFITDRMIHPSAWPAAALQGLPGQDLVWPGEFVLGHPKAGVDPLWPGQVVDPSPAWTLNGSFLVYRRLRQDVQLFWQIMTNHAEELRDLPGFEHVSAESLAAHLVGRRRSGAPLSRLPGWRDVDCPTLGQDRLANNHFLFHADTPSLRLVEGQDHCRHASADPVGLACPLAAHIRKVNPRDAASDTGGTTAALSRRILRVGVPYGPACQDPHGDEESPTLDRGLLFLCIQASIEDQFEFLQSRWMNNDKLPRGPAGHDMIAGQNASAPDGTRRCALFGEGGQEGIFELGVSAVTPTGGGYFFVPSLSALNKVLGG